MDHIATKFKLNLFDKCNSSILVLLPIFILILLSISSNVNSSLPSVFYKAYSINNTVANNKEYVIKFKIPSLEIAFVEPTFTYAAYQNSSFYNFYKIYSNMIDNGSNLTISSDLNLLKNKHIPHGPFPYFEHPSYKDIPYKDYFDLLYQHVSNLSKVKKITDADVTLGKIFLQNGKNAYDILFLFHNEYVTQDEYNNLKKFVYNGGTIVITDANILFAEVSYNSSNDSITLVKGHYWKFNGKYAQHGPSERWVKENKDWMGSNFLDIPSNYKVYFKNNPFNYTHSEEQFVTNPNAKILLNFKAYNLTPRYSNATVATYEMDYGKGMVINLGIWGHTLIYNKAFLDYLDNVIIPIAFIHSINNHINNYPTLSEIINNNSTESDLKNIVTNLTKLKE